MDFRSSPGRCAQPRRLAEAHPQVLIIARALVVVAVIFISGFVVGRDEMTTSVTPAANQPLYCQAKCIGETNVSYQSWMDCINRCMSTGGVG